MTRAHRALAAGITVIAAVALLVALAGGASAHSRAHSSSSPLSIAYSDFRDNNTWTQEAHASFASAAKAAEKQGLISKYTVVTADNSAAQQISQIQTLELEGYKAIMVDAASSTGLNGVIASACAKGIIVVNISDLTTAPCAYKLGTSSVGFGEALAQSVANSLHGKGNVLLVRGIAGTGIDDLLVSGIHKVLKNYPNIKIVGQVYGDWSETTTQQAVAGILPSLPKVNAVINQAIEATGVLRAFQQAKRPTPLVEWGNIGTELSQWKSILKTDKSFKTISLGSVPGELSVGGMWLAYLIHKGTAVSKSLTMPGLEITPSTLDAWAKVTPGEANANGIFDLSQMTTLIQQNKSGHVPVYTTGGPSS
jgi:ribose transport system substrate-binding protein